MSDSGALKLDLGALGALQAQLSQIQGALQGLSNTAREVAGEVGHPGLAAHVNDFASKWDLHRQNLETNVGTLGTHTGKIAESFEQVDTQLASALKGTS